MEPTSKLPVLDRARQHHWRRRWRSHANSARVEAWLTFHNSLRTRLKSMGNAVTTIGLLINGLESKHRENAGQSKRWVAHFLLHFEQYTSLLCDHANFEDDGLFPYFSSISSDFRQSHELLSTQHREIEALEQRLVSLPNILLEHFEVWRRAVDGEQLAPARSVMQLISKASTELDDGFAEYMALVTEHLAEEEMAVVALWLHLTDGQYAGLREALSGGRAGGGGADQAGTAIRMPPLIGSSPAAAGVSRQAAPAQGSRKQSQQQGAEGELVLRDRHGRTVDPRGGCCFDGETTCCKGSALRQLQRRQRTELA